MPLLNAIILFIKEQSSELMTEQPNSRHAQKFWIMCTMGDLGRYSGRYIGRLSTDYRPIVGRQSVDSRSTVGRLSADSRSTVDRLSVDSRPIVSRSVGRLSADASADM